MLCRGCIAVSLVWMACAWPCRGQDTSSYYGAGPEAAGAGAQDVAAQDPPAAEPSSVTFTRTPEMLFYEQERIRAENPKSAIRRRAELKGAQRANRLSALKWYGMSNSRPLVFNTPSMGGGYAPYWASNTYDPTRWRPFAAREVALRPSAARY